MTKREIRDEIGLFVGADSNEKNVQKKLEFAGKYCAGFIAKMREAMGRSDNAVPGRSFLQSSTKYMPDRFRKGNTQQLLPCCEKSLK